MDEYGRRIEKAMAAERLEELDAVLADLPILRIADPSAPGEAEQRRRRAGNNHNGRHHFRSTHTAQLGPAGSAVGSNPVSGYSRIASTLTALLAVAVVMTAVVLLVAVSWTWAGVLLGGWVAGLLQAAAARRRAR